MDHVHKEAKAIISLLQEELLMETGNYSGFMFKNAKTEPKDSDYYNRYYF
jgi:hypothetical protein